MKRDPKLLRPAWHAAALMASAGPPKPKVQFHADHPFLFFIRDVRSGMILFMDRVAEPTAH